jgi:hypothetical protein
LSARSESFGSWLASAAFAVSRKRFDSSGSSHSFTYGVRHGRRGGRCSGLGLRGMLSLIARGYCSVSGTIRNLVPSGDRLVVNFRSITAVCPTKGQLYCTVKLIRTAAGFSTATLKKVLWGPAGQSRVADSPGLSRPIGLSPPWGSAALTRVDEFTIVTSVVPVKTSHPNFTFSTRNLPVFVIRNSVDRGSLSSRIVAPSTSNCGR